MNAHVRDAARLERFCALHGDGDPEIVAADGGGGLHGVVAADGGQIAVGAAGYLYQIGGEAELGGDAYGGTP